MTALEQRFMETVPGYLSAIAEELKRANDLRERELALAEAALKTKEV